MPLTGAEKNKIALATTLLLGVDAGSFTQESLQRRDPVISILFGTVTADLLSALNPVSPRAPPIGSVLSQFRTIRRRGLEPRTSTDPFTGNIVISTRDQDPFLPELLRTRAARRLAAQQDFQPIFRAREAIIKGLASTAADRGFRATIDPNLRGGVFRSAAESPLQFIEGDFL